MAARSWLTLSLALAAAVGAALAFQPTTMAPPPDVPGPVEPGDWFYRQRVFPSGTLDGDAIRRAAAQARAQRRGGDGVTWQLAGPTNIQGRVSALAARSHDEFFVGSASGGVFHTDDGGASFDFISGETFSPATGALALDPQDPATLYVGTGEANGGGGSITYGGTGVWRTRDDGQTWESLGLEATEAIGRVAVHPTDSDVLWVAALGPLYAETPDRGVYRSADGGASWTRTLFVDDRTGAVDLDVNPRGPDTLYAATWERQRRPDLRQYGGDGSGLHRSTDGGVSWTELGGGLPTGADIGRIGVRVAPSRPNVVYATYTDAVGFLTRVYRSLDGGDTWAPTSAGAPHSAPSFGWWFGQVRVDPTDWQTVYSPWLDLYRSTNGGASFSFRSGSMHVDHHALWIDPANPDRLISGNDGGVYRSANGGASWTKTTGGLAVTQFYTAEIDAAAPERLYGGTQDNGTNRTLGPIDGWTFVTGGDGFAVRVVGSTVYSSFQYGNLLRNGANIRPSGARFNWSSPLEIDPFDPETIYYGSTVVHRSTNRGTSWTTTSPDLTGGPGQNIPFGTLTTISASPVAPGVLWAGTDDGRVWRTDGQVWTNVSAGLPERWVTRVTAHPADADAALVTLSGFRQDDSAAQVFSTTDGGATWTPLSAGLPDAPCNDVLYDPALPSRLYLATDVGVYTSEDSGATWAPLGTGLPAVPVNDLDLEGSKLVAATFGRSIWTADVGVLVDADAGPPADRFAVSVAPNPVRARATVRYALDRAGRVALDVIDVRGRVVARLAGGDRAAGAHTAEWDARGLAAGLYTVRLAGQGRAKSVRATVVR